MASMDWDKVRRSPKTHTIESLPVYKEPLKDEVYDDSVADEIESEVEVTLPYTPDVAPHWWTMCSLCRETLRYKNLSNHLRNNHKPGYNYEKVELYAKLFAAGHHHSHGDPRPEVKRELPSKSKPVPAEKPAPKLNAGPKKADVRQSTINRHWRELLSEPPAEFLGCIERYIDRHADVHISRDDIRDFLAESLKSLRPDR
jgi:hypothetical protein